MSSRRFHGYFTSADASGLSEPNSRITLYEDGTVTSITLAATESVVVTDIIFATATTITAKFYDGADNVVDAGELMFAEIGSAAYRAAVPHTCQLATYPKIKTSGAGQIDAVIRGYIVS